MNSSIQLKTPTRSKRNSIGGGFLVALLLVCIGLLPRARAVSPPPDGGYANFNTAEGTNALLHLTSGIYNTALGGQALFNDTGGGYNTAVGLNTLYLNTTGNYNTASGYEALFRNTTGIYNTANGFKALLSNTTGQQNTATGGQALISNTIGTFNTANGVNALYHNTTGFSNVADGHSALFSNADGGQNTAIGDSALYHNTTGDYNTANGVQALFNNTDGSQNTGIGASALFAATTGAFNTASGFNALAHDIGGSSNTASGHAALVNNISGSNNVALGRLAGANLDTGDNNIDIGYNVTGVAGESNTIRIGNTDITDTFIRGISGAAVTGTAVVVNSNGKLGVATSSARFKDEIKAMGAASEAILALRPVAFRYKKGIDPQGIPQFGLVAEEVEKVNQDLIIRDSEGKPYTVRYEAVNAMLLNEFLKAHRKMEEQEATIAQLRKDFGATVAQLTARLDQQASQIQKVSTQLEVSKPAPRIVRSNQ